jgi:hypothetical protein
MPASTTTRRGRLATFAGLLAGGAAAALVTAPAALAETDPCEAAQIAKTIGRWPPRWATTWRPTPRPTRR